ncbi:conserved hypothetical protein [Treponema pallidum subsp. pallidum str. Chicago]|nr:conserved hypothetical protein [Treponema pallidum subsp. pallidum str. Chicago]
MGYGAENAGLRVVSSLLPGGMVAGLSAVRTLLSSPGCVLYSRVWAREFSSAIIAFSFLVVSQRFYVIRGVVCA